MRGPKLARRFRWRRFGGRVEVRVYADGSSRLRVDHPSNDPAVEFAMLGAVLSLTREKMTAAGIDLIIGPAQWRDDP